MTPTYFYSLTHRLFWFTAIGTVIMILELGLTAGLLYGIGLHYLPAIGIGFLSSLIISYFPMRRFAFYGTARKVHSGFVYFSIIATFGLALTLAGSYIGVTYLGLHPLLAQYLMSIISSGLSFLLNSFINFEVR